MTDLEIANMLADYHKECEAAETLRERADVQLKHARLIREALSQPLVISSFCSCTKFRETPIINGKYICSICNKPIVQTGL